MAKLDKKRGHVYVQTQMPLELKEALKRIAFHQGVPLHVVVIEACREFMREWEEDQGRVEIDVPQWKIERAGRGARERDVHSSTDKVERMKEFFRKERTGAVVTEEDIEELERRDTRRERSVDNAAFELGMSLEEIEALEREVAGDARGAKSEAVEGKIRRESADGASDVARGDTSDGA